MKPYIKFIALFFSIFFSAELFCQEIYQIKEVLDHLQGRKALIVFDIDNTLLMPETDLGSDQWFSHMVQKHMDTGCKVVEAVDLVLPLYIHVSLNLELISVEDELCALIEDIKSAGDYVICLTARSACLAHKVIEQLHKNDLCFYTPEFHHLEADFKSPGLYRSGVLFCDSHDKGDVLISFLDSINYEPELIIFIDDKIKNVHAVEKVAQQRSIAFIGLRYAGCDHRVHAFNAEVTHHELQKFLAEYPLDVQ